MATIDDALEQVAKDPPAGFVGLAVVGAQPPNPGVIVVTKGRQLLLPDWTGEEWAWYGNLAAAIARVQPAKNDVGTADKARALTRLQGLMPAMRTLGAAGKPAAADAGNFYDASVRLVIASNAAASGPTAGELAAQAFGAALLEAPTTIVTALRSGLEKGLSNMTKVQKEAATILGEIFIQPIKAIGSGLLAGLGPTGIILIGGVLYYMFGRKGR